MRNGNDDAGDSFWATAQRAERALRRVGMVRLI